MESKQVGPVRNLSKDPLDDAELEALAAGAPPRYLVTMAMCDTEEIVMHMAARLRSLLVIAQAAAEDADGVAYSEFNDDSAEHTNKIAAWKVGL